MDRVRAKAQPDDRLRVTRRLVLREQRITLFSVALQAAPKS